MNTAAEKIRQVVEETQEYFNCITAQKEAALYAQLKLLDAIIEEMNNYLEYHEYHLKESPRSQLHSGAKEALRRQIKTLKEARTSLTTTL